MMTYRRRPPFVATRPDRTAAVIVAAPNGDPHGDVVLQELASSGVPAARLTAQSFVEGQIEWTPGGPLQFSDCGERWIAAESTTVWWRRPGVPEESGLDELEARLVAEEVAVLLPGVLTACGVRWVDAPWNLARARMKPVQLAEALGLGIPLPDTTITGHPGAAERFASVVEVVAKASSTGRGIAPFVATLDAAQAYRVAACPTTLQARVDAAADIRIVTIRSEAHVWSRSRAAGDRTDWREVDPSGSGFRYEGTLADPLPAQLATNLGLTFSVQDWLDTAHGALFLEVNPQGQWLFLEDAARVVAPALASHLATTL